MTQRVSASVLVATVTLSVLYPLGLLLYPNVAQADIVSCAASYITQLTGWGTEHTSVSGVTEPIVTTEVGIAHGVIATAVSSETIQVGVTNPNEATQLSSIAAILGASHTQQVAAGARSVVGTASGQNNDFMSCIVKPLVEMMAQRILANITSSLVNWIQGGFNGNPTFVTNIDHLVSQSANQAIGEFINTTQLGFLCKPFSAQISIALATAFSPQQFQGCTLSQIDQNISQFGNTHQAWQSWLHISATPANNQYGAYIQASGALSDLLSSQLNKLNSMVNRNGGFLDFTTCPGGYFVDVPGGEGGETSPANKGDKGAYCPNPVTTTPGKTIQDAVSSKFGNDFNDIGLATDIDQIIGALVNTLVSKTLTGTAGLLGASTPSANSSTNITALAEASSTSNTDTINSLGNSVSAAQSTQSTSVINGTATNLALTAAISASSVAVGSDPKNAIDDNLSTTFISDNEKTPSFVADLGTSQSFNEIQIAAPSPLEATLGNIEVEISNSSTFNTTDPSTQIWDAKTNTFVSAAKESQGAAFNSTTTSLFDIVTPATAEFVKVIKASNTSVDSVGNCVSGQTDSTGACMDPLQISEIQILTQSAASQTSSASTNSTSQTGTTPGPSVSFTGNPATSSITLSGHMSTASSYSLSISPSGTIATPVSATITLSALSGTSPSNAFSYESLMRTNNGQSSNIDLSDSLLNTGVLPISNIQLPTQIDLSIQAKTNATGSFNFTVDLKDANGVDLGSNTETFLITP